MSGVRVLIFNHTDDEAGIEAAYHEVSRELAGVPGLIGNELLRSMHDPKGFVVMSLWESVEAFDTWEQGVSHKGSTSPLRPFRDTSMNPPFGVYQVSAAYLGEQLVQR